MNLSEQTEKQLPKKKRRAIREILQYFRKNPESGDTLENIVNWWVPAERLLPHRNEVEEALAYLVIHGLVSETILPGGTKWYRANPDKKSEMTQFTRLLA